MALIGALDWVAIPAKVVQVRSIDPCEVAALNWDAILVRGVALKKEIANKIIDQTNLLMAFSKD